MKHIAAGVVLGSLKSESISSEEAAFLKEFRPAGLTLFRRNIPSEGRELPTGLCQNLLQKYSDGGLPFLMAIDQEGGRVARLRAPFPECGPAMDFARNLPWDIQAEKLRDWGQQVGSLLKKTGIGINFAPVLDVLSEPSNTAIGDRAYGTNPKEVCHRAGAFLEGLREGGVLPCLKHFPGQGAASKDTHFDSCVISAPLKLLRERDLLPFAKLSGFSPMIMMSHCIYTALDDREASMSPKIMQDLLRQEMGFKGVIVTDDMTMGAISRRAGTQEELIVESISQGADLALVCEGLENWQRAIEALQKEGEKSPVLRDRLREASGRVNAMRKNLVL